MFDDLKVRVLKCEVENERREKAEEGKQRPYVGNLGRMRGRGVLVRCP